MLTGLKKWFLKKFWCGKPIEFDGRIYTILDVFSGYILTDTPYFVKHIQNKDVNKIKLLKINKEAMVGQKVYYYDQQNDENKSGTITYIGQDGTMKLDNDNVSHVNWINVKKNMRRYKKSCIFKHDGKWYTIQNCFLTEKGLAYNCTGYDLLGYVYLEDDIIKFNKEF